MKYIDVSLVSVGKLSGDIGENLVDISFEDLIKVVPRFFDSVVGDAVLRKVKGSNFFCSHGSSDCSFSLFIDRAESFFFFYLPNL